MAVVDTHQLAQKAEFTTFWVRCKRLRTSLIEHEIQVKEAKAFLHEARLRREGALPSAQPSIFEAAVNVLEAEVDSASKVLDQIKETVLQNEELVNAFLTHYISLKTTQDESITKTQEENEELHMKQKAAGVCLSEMENAIKTTHSKMQKAVEAACYANEKEAKIIQVQGVNVRTLLEAFGGDSAHETKNATISRPERSFCSSVRKRVSSLGSSIQKKKEALRQSCLKFLNKIESRGKSIKVIHLGIGLSVLVVLFAGVMFFVYTDGKIDNAMTEIRADISRIDSVMKETHDNISWMSNNMNKKMADIDCKMSGKEAHNKIGLHNLSAQMVACTIVDVCFHMWTKS